MDTSLLRPSKSKAIRPFAVISSRRKTALSHTFTHNTWTRPFFDRQNQKRFVPSQSSHREERPHYHTHTHTTPGHVPSSTVKIKSDSSFAIVLLHTNESSHTTPGLVPSSTVIIKSDSSFAIVLLHTNESSLHYLIAHCLQRASNHELYTQNTWTRPFFDRQNQKRPFFDRQNQKRFVLRNRFIAHERAIATRASSLHRCIISSHTNEQREHHRNEDTSLLRPPKSKANYCNERITAQQANMSVPTEETASYMFLSYVYHFHRFLPKFLRDNLGSSRWEPWFSSLTKQSFDSLEEEDMDRLLLYWKYDQPLLAGGYSLERLWYCHGADITLHDGTVLPKHPGVPPYVDDPDDEENTWEKYFRNMRELYVEDIHHVTVGGVLSDLCREYCFPLQKMPKLSKRNRQVGDRATFYEPLLNLRPRIPRWELKKRIKEELFRHYVGRMTGIPYAELWPDARYLWAECWEHDNVLLKAGYTYERLKILHLEECNISVVNGLGRLEFYRLKPKMFVNWGNSDDMEEAREAPRANPSFRTLRRFKEDIQDAIQDADKLINSTRRDLRVSRELRTVVGVAPKESDRKRKATGSNRKRKATGSGRGKSKKGKTAK